MNWHAAVYVGEILAVALGWEVVRRRAEHWPAAGLCTIALGSDAVRLLIKRVVTIEGWSLALHHADQALFLAWYAGFAAAAIVAWLRRKSWPVIVAWMAALVAFVTTSPLGHRLALSRYHAIHFVALSLAIMAAILGVLRPASRLTVTRAAVLLVTFTEFAVLLSPEVSVRWATAQAIYTCGFASVALLHAGFLVRSWIRVRWPCKGLVPAFDATEDTLRPSEP